MVTRVLIPIEDLLFEEEIRQFLVQLNTLAVKVKVLHVIDANEAVYRWPSTEYYNESDLLVRTIGERLRDYFPGVEIETAVREGIVKEEIAREAEAFKADIVLVGAHGKSGLGKLLLGSTSKELIPTSPCTVVVLKKKSPVREENETANKGRAVAAQSKKKNESRR